MGGLILRGVEFPGNGAWERHYLNYSNRATAQLNHHWPGIGENLIDGEQHLLIGNLPMLNPVFDFEARMTLSLLNKELVGPEYSDKDGQNSAQPLSDSYTIFVTI